MNAHASSNGNAVDGNGPEIVTAPTLSTPDNLFTWHSTSMPPPAPSTELIPSPRLENPEANQAEAGEVPPINSADERALDTTPPPADWEGEREEDSQDDDSTDEEDYSFWANLKEDTSSPDEEELKVIEENGHEISALDREYRLNLIWSL